MAIIYVAKSQSLAKWGADVGDNAWREIHWGMTRTSKWAHDQPAAPGTPPPSPDELKEEMDKIRACHEMIKKEQTETGRRRKKSLEPPSA